MTVVSARQCRSQMSIRPGLECNDPVTALDDIGLARRLLSKKHGDFGWCLKGYIQREGAEGMDQGDGECHG